MKTHNFHATRAVDVYRGRTGSPIAGVSSIYGSAISGPPSDGNVLVWDAATGTWLVESAGMAPLNTISPSQLVANTDNWNPTDLSTADVIRVSTDASRNLTGIVAPSKSRKIVLENVGAQPLVLKHDATSTAANRFYCPGDTDYTVAKDSAVLVVYDVTSSRWRVVDGAIPSVPAFATPSIAYGTPAGGAASTVIRSDATIAKPTAADVDFSADVTTNNASTSAHGLLKKLDNTSTHYMDGTGGWSTPAGAGGGALIGVQRITATGAYTYTPTAGTTSIVLELVGAGGGGAAVAAGGGSATRVGPGGGAGGYLRKRLTANFSGATGSVGAKGTAGASGGDNAGNPGGDTTFVDTAGSPTTYTAIGGEATRVGPQNGANVVICGENYGGGATNGDVNVPGGNSLTGIGSSLSTAKAKGGDGGSGPYGSGGAGGFTTTTVAGVAATGKGGGGGGAANVGGTASAAGGDGTDGIVIIWEYS